MRIAIMGSGGLGGYYGGMLASAREDVTFIALGSHLESIRSDGLTVKLSSGEEFTLDAKATNDPGEIGPVDIVWFCVKTYDTDTAAEQIRPMIGPETMIASIQNGVDNERRIEGIFGPGHFVPGVSYVNGLIEKPGVIFVRFAGMTSFGEINGSVTSRIEQLVGSLQQAGVEVESRTDMERFLWDKFVVICGAGGAEILARQPMGPVLATPETTDLMIRLLHEGVAVAKGMGIDLSPGLPDKLLEIARNRIPPTHRTSMFEDLLEGKRLEVEALNGTLVRLGSEHGVETPLNFAVYAALKPYVDGGLATL
jgi:2-dehydropantoate 2-reductase